MDPNLIQFIVILVFGMLLILKSCEASQFQNDLDRVKLELQLEKDYAKKLLDELNICRATNRK